MRILFVTGRYPYPPSKGDQLRAFHQIVHLAARHSVTLLSFTEGKGAVGPDPLPGVCERVVVVKAPGGPAKAAGVVSSLVRGAALQNGLYRSRMMRRACAGLTRREAFDVVVVQLMRMFQCVDGVVDAPTVVDLVDSMGLNMSLRAGRARTPWERWFWRFEQRRSAAYERRLCARAAVSIVVSRRDRAAIASERVVVIPNGVAVETFAYTREGREPARIAFWGNLRYFINRDAVQTLVGRVMPRVWQDRPEATVDLIGPSPPRGLTAGLDARVRVPGFVEDLPSRIAAATVAAFPIWEASGIQNKVLEAMSSGLPVVTTPGVVAGIDARPEEEVLVGRSPEEIARQVLRLLGDPGLQDRMARHARRLVERRYTWKRSVDGLEELLIRHAAHRGPGRSRLPGPGTA